MKGNKKLFATAPVGNGTYINEGDKFEVSNIKKANKDKHGRSFNIMTKDTGQKLFCLEFECEHLNGHSWIITEE